MKKIFLTIALIIFISLSSCSNDEPPSLESLLFGTYSIVGIDFLPDSSNIWIYEAIQMDSTFLQINADGSFSMRLKIYIPLYDSVINISQSGSYSIRNKQYIKSIGYFSQSHWEATLLFLPGTNKEWGGKINIAKTYRFCFTHSTIFKIPNSISQFIILCWIKF